MTNCKRALHDLALDAHQLSVTPMVPVHDVTAPRIAFMHTWLATQTEGWWRYAFDTEGIPFDYISTQTVAKQDDLRSKYDVIVFAPVGRASRYRHHRRPAHVEQRTPVEEIGPDAESRPQSTPPPTCAPASVMTASITSRNSSKQGGLLITCEDTAQFAIDTGLAPGVSVAPRGDARVVGSVLDTVFVTPRNPVAFGYEKSVPVISAAAWPSTSATRWVAPAGAS